MRTNLPGECLLGLKVNESPVGSMPSHVQSPDLAMQFQDPVANYGIFPEGEGDLPHLCRKHRDHCLL